MNGIMSEITSVAMMIGGIALLAVIVSRNSNTTAVISSASGGFAQVLGVAMGGASGATPYGMH